jgi:hypothetical protein
MLWFQNGSSSYLPAMPYSTMVVEHYNNFDTQNFLFHITEEKEEILIRHEFVHGWHLQGQREVAGQDKRWILN